MHIDAMQQHFTGILEGLDEDPVREGLLRTLERAAKAMAYLCHGYQQDLDHVINGAVFISSNDDTVLLKD